MIHGGKQSETRISIKTKTLFSWDWFFNYYIKCSFFKKYKFQESVSKAFLQEVIISSPEGKQHAPGLSTKTLFIHASDLFLALQSQMWFQKYYPKFVFCRQKYQQKKSIKWSQGKSKPQEEAATWRVWLHKGIFAGLEPFKPSSLRMWNSSPETLPVHCAFITDAEYWNRARLPASLLGDHRLAPHLQLCQSLAVQAEKTLGL